MPHSTRTFIQSRFPYFSPRSRLAAVGATCLGLTLLGCQTPSTHTHTTTETNVAPRAQQSATIATSPDTLPHLFPPSAPLIYADSAILIDAQTGRVLYQKNADKQRPVASTQKLLTALLIAEAGNLEESITICLPDTSVEPTKLSVRCGQRYSRRSLLTAMMVKSCNDAAAALARDHSGSTTAFAAQMNDRARMLGATSSHFVNPHGLPSNQYSTARDLARIAFVAYRNPELRNIMRLPSYSFPMANGRSQYLETTNRLLLRSQIFNGMKTGYTMASGRCLVTSARWGGRDLILVQLGSKTSYIFSDAEQMIRWALSSPRSISNIALASRSMKLDP